MKKILVTLTTIICCIFSLYASSPSPQDIAKKFLVALYSGDRTTMMECLTQEQARIQGQHSWNSAKEPGMVEVLNHSTSRVFDSTYNSSVKVVRFYVGRDSFASVEVTKENGKWKLLSWGH